MHHPLGRYIPKKPHWEWFINGLTTSYLFGDDVFVTTVIALRKFGNIQKLYRSLTVIFFSEKVGFSVVIISLLQVVLKLCFLQFHVSISGNELSHVDVHISGKAGLHIQVLEGAVPVITGYIMLYHHSCRGYNPTYGWFSRGNIYKSFK